MFSNKHNRKLDGRRKAQNRKRPAAWRDRIFHPATALALAIVLLGLGAGVAWALNYAGNVTVIATMGQLNPNPIRVGDTATASLSATYEPPGNVPEGTFPTAQYSWSVAVAYKALYAESYGAPPPNSYTLSISPSQPSSSGGAEITFTPLIAGYWQLTGSCGVTVTDQAANEYWTGSANTAPANVPSYFLHIEYGGRIVDGETQAVSVGEQVALTADFGPVDMKITWNPAGNVVAGYTQSLTKANAVSLPSADLHAGTIIFYYVSAGASGTEEGDADDVALSSSFGGSPSVFTTFDEYEPSATLTATYEGTVAADSNYLGDYDQAAGAWNSSDTWLHFGGSYNPPRDGAGSYTPGVEFVASWSQPPVQYGDNLFFVQTISYLDSYYYDSQGIEHSSGWTGGSGSLLDTSLPYGYETGGPPGIAGTTSDSPGVSLAAAAGIAGDSMVATMHLMYQPSTPHSIPVPVQSVIWDWEGLAGNTSGTWSATGSPSPGGQESGGQEIVEPAWVNNVADLSWQ